MIKGSKGGQTEKRCRHPQLFYWSLMCWSLQPAQNLMVALEKVRKQNFINNLISFWRIGLSSKTSKISAGSHKLFSLCFFRRSLGNPHMHTHTRSPSLSSFLPLLWKRTTEWVIAILYILARSTRRPHSHRARPDNGCIRINWSDIWWVYLSLFVECNEWKWPLSLRLTDPCTALQLRLCHFPLLLYRYA